MAIVRWAACFFGFAAAVLLVGACGGAASSATPTSITSNGTVSATTPSATNAVKIQGYLESDSNEVVFLNLTLDGSSTSGQMTTSKVDSTADSGVKGSSAKFTAQVAGSAITLDFGSVQWTGQTTPSGLVLLIPDSSGQLVSYSFHNATSDDYNAAVSKLSASVTTARAQQTAQANAAAADASAQANASAIARATVAAKTFAKADQVIDATKDTYTATMVTSKGTIVIKLDATDAPNTVNSLVFLAQKKFFDGLTFHRVISGFVIQGGDPQGDGSGGPGYSTNDEPNKIRNTTGTLSMAKGSGASSFGSQFFINLRDNTSLDYDNPTANKFYPFATVTSGMDVVNAIAAVPVDSNDKPTTPVTIQTVTITATPK